MKPEHEQYAEEIVEKFWPIVASEPFEPTPVPETIYYSESIQLAILYIEGQIEVLKRFADKSGQPDVIDGTMWEAHSLQKSITYLKSKL